MNAEEYYREVDRSYGLLRGPELENRIRQLCKQCAEEYGASHPLHAAMLSELGGFYRGQDKLEESEACFLQAMELLEGAGCGSSANYATLLNNLAGTHRRQGKLELAEEEFRRCMELYRQAGEGESLLGASCLNNLSQVLLDREDFAGAAELLNRAVELLHSIPAAQQEYAASLINLASVRFRLKEYPEAAAELKEAVRLMENDPDTVTSHYHAALNLLGMIGEAAGDGDRAAEYYRRALAAAEALYEPEHPEVRAIRYRLNRCLEGTT